MVRALVVSLLLHLGIMMLFFVAPMPDVSVDIDFRESRGVALMSQIGYAPPTDREDEFAEVDEVEQVDPEATEVPQEAEAAPEEPPQEEAPAEEEPAEETSADDEEEEVNAPEEAPEEVPDEEEPLEVLPPSDTGTAPPARTPDPPRQDPADEPETNGESERENGAAENETEPEEEVDPASLPPRQRYPEGTLNPVATDVGMWGPEGAASVAVIRNDRVRRSPHRNAIVGIFSGLGDYQTLTERTDIDLIDDVDVMLLASTNVTNANETFIAVVHQLDPGYLMGELQRGYPTGVNWEERDGRFFGTPGAPDTLPRRFFIPTEQLLIYTQPRFLEPLIGSAPRPRGLDGALDRVEAPPEPPTVDAILVELGLPEAAPEPYDGSDVCDDRRGLGRRRCQERVDERTAESNRAIEAYETQRESLLPIAEARVEEATEAYEDFRENGIRNRPDREPPVRSDTSWIRGLLEAGDLAGTGNDGPAVLWTFNGFNSFNLGGLRRGTVAPQQLVAGLELSRDPELRARFVFPSQAAAEDFQRQWGAIVEHYTFPLTAAGLLGAFRDAEWELDQNEAIGTFAIPGSAMNRLSTAIRLMSR